MWGKKCCAENLQQVILQRTCSRNLQDSSRDSIPLWTGVGQTTTTTSLNEPTYGVHNNVQSIGNNKILAFYTVRKNDTVGWGSCLKHSTEKGPVHCSREMELGSFLEGLAHHGTQIVFSQVSCFWWRSSVFVVIYRSALHLQNLGKRGAGRGWQSKIGEALKQDPQRRGKDSRSSLLHHGDSILCGGILSREWNSKGNHVSK